MENILKKLQRDELFTNQVLKEMQLLFLTA